MVNYQVPTQTRHPMSLRGLLFWHNYYTQNPRARPIWTDNAGIVAYLTEHIYQRKLELGMICL